MKIIKKSQEKEYKRIWNVICEKCKTELEIEYDDIKFDNVFGCGYCNCPVCDNKIEEDDFPDLDINAENIQYPRHFYDFADGKDVDDNYINEKIKEMIEKIDTSKDYDIRTWGSGNTFIVAQRFSDDEEINIVVCKDYKECFINL